MGLGTPGHSPTPAATPSRACPGESPSPPPGRLVESAGAIPFRSPAGRGTPPPRQPPTASTHRAALPARPAPLRLGLAAGGVAALPCGPVARPGAEHGPLPPSVRPAGSPLPAPPPPAAPPPRATAAAVKATARRHHVVGPWGRHGPRDLAGREGRRGKGRDGTRCPSWGIPVAWTCWSGPPGPEAGERKRAKGAHLSGSPGAPWATVNTGWLGSGGGGKPGHPSLSPPPSFSPSGAGRPYGRTFSGPWVWTTGTRPARAISTWVLTPKASTESPG